ncbi:MAG: SUMF1/EgtB/PvdO family nonheme iron enzyme, partial [Desulfobacterales bacterium]|nr:SUMF1/EgtB/PvdO family nonheme iron enzyme [Desulfobacterales bacterium]
MTPIEQIIYKILGAKTFDALIGLLKDNRTPLQKAYDEALEKTKQWYEQEYKHKFGRKNNRFFHYQISDEELEKFCFILQNPDIKLIAQLKIDGVDTVPEDIVQDFVDHLIMEMGKYPECDDVFAKRDLILTTHQIGVDTSTLVKLNAAGLKEIEEQTRIQRQLLEITKGSDKAVTKMEIKPLNWRKLYEVFKKELSWIKIKHIGRGFDRDDPERLKVSDVYFEQSAALEDVRYDLPDSESLKDYKKNEKIKKFLSHPLTWSDYISRYLKERGEIFEYTGDANDGLQVFCRTAEAFVDFVRDRIRELTSSDFRSLIEKVAKKTKSEPAAVIGILDWYFKHSRRSEPLLKLVKPPFSCLVTGNAGSGKTTAMKALGGNLFRNLEKADNDGNPTPIFVRLHALPESFTKVPDKTKQRDTLIEYVCNDWNRQLDADTQLSNEALVNQRRTVQLLLDGFDEIASEEMRKSLATTVAAMVQDAFNIIVTSRPAAIDESMLDSFSLPQIRLLDLTEPQINDFVHRFYKFFRERDPELAEDNTTSFISALEESDSALELAGNPLYLTVMILMHVKDEILPQRRLDLFCEFVNMLLYQRKLDSAREQKGFSPVFRLEVPGGRNIVWQESTYIDLLSRIALSVHRDTKESVYIVPQKVSDAVMEQKSLRRVVRGINLKRLEIEFIEFCDGTLGILEKRGRYHSFSHRVIQEYFAAMRISGFEKGDILKFWETEALADPLRWNEVARLLFCKIKEKEYLFDYLEEKWSEDILKTSNSRAVKMVVESLYDLQGYYSETDKVRYLAEEVKTALIAKRDASHKEREMFLTCSDALGFIGEPEIGIQNPPAVRLEAEKPFKMGGEGKDEYSHEVSLSPFWINKYPVTNSEFKEFIRQGGYKDGRYWQDDHSKFGFDGRKFKKEKNLDEPLLWNDERFGRKRPLAPVVGVSWYEAMAFCRWWTLTYGSEWGQSRGIDGEVMMRLPTEAEWEFSAKGYEDREYPWGDKPPDSKEGFANVGKWS